MSGMFAGIRGGSWFTLLAMAFAVLAGLLVFAVLQSDREQTPVIETVRVVVATEEIAPRTVITDSMVRVEELPAGVAVDLVFRDTAAVVGLVARYPISPREQLTQFKVGTAVADDGGTADGLSFVIPPGKRGIGVAVTEQSAVGGLIIAGDRVDVIAVFEEDDNRESRSITLLQDVEVLAVAQAAKEPVPPSLTATEQSKTSDGDGIARQDDLGVRPAETTPQPEARTVTLAVSPTQAQELALAGENAELWLSLRPFEDAETASLGPTNLTSLIGGSLAFGLLE